MGWKDSIKPITSDGSSQSWKDTITPIDPQTDDGYLAETGAGLLSGVAQGLTLGGADEIAGGAQALTEKGLEALGAKEETPESLGDLYRRYQQLRQSQLEGASEKAPVASLVGELAGGLALPVGVLGAAGKGAVGAAKWLPKIATGAGMGAIAGGLGSKGTIEGDDSLLGKDILTGAAIGGTAGPAIEKVVGSLPGLASKISEKTGLTGVIENYPTLRQTKTALNEGLAGRPILGEKGLFLRQNQLNEASSQLDNPLMRGRKIINEKFSEVLQNSPPLTLTSELQNDLQVTKKLLNANKTNLGLGIDDLPSMQGKIATNENKGMEKIIDEALATGKIEPQKLKELQKFARDNQGSFHAGNADEYLESLNNTAKAMLDRVPGYKEINSQFGKYEDVLSSFAKKVPVDQLESFGKKASGEKLYKTSEDVISKATLPYDVGKKQAEQLRSLGENLTELGRGDPSLLEKMGISDVQSFINNAKNASDIQSVGKTLRSSGQFGQTSGFSIGGLSRAGMQGGALLVGSTANKLSNMGSTLAKMPSQGLNDLAQRLSTNPITKHLGDGLANAVAAAPGSASKNAILFTIMQNPTARKTAREFVGVDEEKEE